MITENDGSSTPASPSTVVDSAIFRNMFATDAMREVFSDAGVLRRYLEIEAALAKVQAEIGLIPAEAAQTIGVAIRSLIIDQSALRAATDNVGYPIVGVVHQIAAACDGDAGQYVHWGATTQDIMDTAVVLQVRDGLVLIENALQRLAGHLSAQAARHRDTPMAGRTHLQHALPVTFGYKCAVWLSAVLRHQERLDQIRPRALQGQFAGASGTLASLYPHGVEVHGRLMRELGLEAAACPWHSMRDSLSETTGLLALIAGTLSKIATDISLMMMTELGEVSEEYAPNRGASSTMPQKHNPILCEMILGTGRIVRQNAATMMESVCVDFERATGPWHTEWHALPQAFLNISAGLAHANDLLENLEVHPARMQANLGLTKGGISAEAVMMDLARPLGRQNAYKLVQQAVRTAVTSGASLVETLSSMPEVADNLSPEKIETLLTPANYLGHSADVVDHIVTRANARLAGNTQLNTSP